MDSNNTIPQNSPISEQEFPQIPEIPMLPLGISSQQLQVDIEEAIEMAEEARLMEILLGSEQL